MSPGAFLPRLHSHYVLSWFAKVCVLRKPLAHIAIITGLNGSPPLLLCRNNGGQGIRTCLDTSLHKQMCFHLHLSFPPLFQAQRENGPFSRVCFFLLWSVFGSPSFASILIHPEFSNDDLCFRALNMFFFCETLSDTRILCTLPTCGHFFYGVKTLVLYTHPSHLFQLATWGALQTWLNIWNNSSVISFPQAVSFCRTSAGIRNLCGVTTALC